MAVQGTSEVPSPVAIDSSQRLADGQRRLAEQLQAAQLAAWQEQLRQVQVRHDQFRAGALERRVATADRRTSGKLDGRTVGRRYSDLIPNVEAAGAGTQAKGSVTGGASFRVGQNPEAGAQQWQDTVNAERVTSPTALGSTHSAAGSTESAASREGGAFEVPAAGLQYGDRGPEVEKLQNFLVAMGYLTLAELQTGPGIFGPMTKGALTAYQDRIGLPATGYYGELSQAAAQRAVDAQVVPEFQGAGSGGGGGTDTPRTPSLGAPSGTIPMGLNVAYGRGGSWAQVNQYDSIFLEAGARHGVDPAMLKAMAVIESGGQMIPNGNGSGAYGIMQIKPGIWGGLASSMGYDLYTPWGQIGFAAAMLGGDVAGVWGSTPEERFLSTYYPTPGLDVPGEDGHTPRQYLEDLATLKAIINQAG